MTQLALTKSQKRRRLRADLTGYGFLLPAILGFALFILFPLVMSFALGFTEWNLVSGLKGIKFVGLDNFVKLFQEEYFVASLKNNIIYTALYVPLSLLLGLLLALLLNAKLYGRSLLRTMIFMPYISNIVAVSIVWMALFQPTKGPINQLLISLGVMDPPRWLASPDWAMFVLVIIGVWINTGYNMVLFLAGLQNIPRELQEAAVVDGATGVQRFWYVDLPLLTPTLFFLTITGFMTSFKMFNSVKIITQGGPGMSTTVLVYYLYVQAFTLQKFGYSSAIAIVLFILIFLITFLQWKGQKKWVNYV